MIRRVPFPVYDPSTDATLSLWLDGSDSTTIQTAASGSITNGATVGQWHTKAGTARNFQLIGPNTRPTFETNVVNGLSAVRCNNQILSADVKTGMQSLSGRTVSVVFKQVANTPGAAEGYVVTEPHETTTASGPMVLMYGSTSGFASGGRRRQGDTFVFSQNIDPRGESFGAPVVQNGDVFLVSAIYDYAAGRIRPYSNGHGGPAHPLANGVITSGVTAAVDPYAISVGGVLQEQGDLGTNTGNGFMNGYVCEVLDWFVKLTEDQLWFANNYLMRKWGIK